MLFGNIGNAIQPGSMLGGGSSPNTTGTNAMLSRSPAGSLFGVGRSAPSAPAPMTSPALHASGLPNQPPSGVNPQLWASVLQHLQQTNFGSGQRLNAQPNSPDNLGMMGIPQAVQAEPGRMQRPSWAPLPSQQPSGPLPAPFPRLRLY